MKWASAVGNDSSGPRDLLVIVIDFVVVVVRVTGVIVVVAVNGIIIGFIIVILVVIASIAAAVIQLVVLFGQAVGGIARSVVGASALARGLIIALRF